MLALNTYSLIVLIVDVVLLFLLFVLFRQMLFPFVGILKESALVSDDLKRCQAEIQAMVEEHKTAITILVERNQGLTGRLEHMEELIIRLARANGPGVAGGKEKTAGSRPAIDNQIEIKRLTMEMLRRALAQQELHVVAEGQLPSVAGPEHSLKMEQYRIEIARLSEELDDLQATYK